MDNIEIGKKIAKYRKDNKMTQQELADKLNVTNKTISKWETGTTMPDLITIGNICKILKITPEKLLRQEKIETIENDCFIKKRKIKKILYLSVLVTICYY